MSNTDQPSDSTTELKQKKPYLGKMVLRFYLRDIAGLATLISLLLIELLEYNDFFN